MAHLPSMAALALSVPTGASTKRKTPLSADEEAEKEAAKKQKLEEKKKEQALVQKRIAEMLASKTPEGDEPIAGWEPGAGPSAEQSCCTTTGGRFGDHLPEALRGDEYVSVPTPKSRNVFSITVVDAGGLERAKAAQREQGKVEREEMSQKEWDARYGEKRQAQIDALKKSLPGYANYVNRVPKESRRFELRSTIHPSTPNASNRKYSKRDWQSSVSAWTRQVHEVWGAERQQAEREPRRVEADAMESES